MACPASLQQGVGDAPAGRDDSWPVAGRQSNCTLTQSGGRRRPGTGFTVTVAADDAPEIARSVQGTFTVRDAFVRVTQVDAGPGFVAPGGSVQVSARVLNVVNQARQAVASYVVKDSGGQTIYTSSSAPVTLDVQASLTTVDLGHSTPRDCPKEITRSR